MNMDIQDEQDGSGLLILHRNTDVRGSDRKRYMSQQSYTATIFLHFG